MTDRRPPRDLAEILAPVQMGQSQVEAELDRCVADSQLPMLQSVLTSVLGGSGKRLRPAISLLIGQAYRVDPAEVVLLATGSECAIADEARQMLEVDGVPTRLVSLPCWELFDEQEPAYRESVLGTDAIRVAVEAASPLGWERYIGPDGAVVGMRSFGGSAPAKELYAHFGITADAVVAAAKVRL